MVGMYELDEDMQAAVDREWAEWAEECQRTWDEKADELQALGYGRIPDNYYGELFELDGKVFYLGRALGNTIWTPRQIPTMPKCTHFPVPNTAEWDEVGGVIMTTLEIKQIAEWMLENIGSHLGHWYFNPIDTDSLAQAAAEEFDLGEPSSIDYPDELFELTLVINNRMQATAGMPTVGWVMKRWMERFGKRGSPGIPKGG